MSFARDWCGMREVAHISRLSVQLDKSDITNVCIMLLMTLNIIIITYFIYLYSSALAYVELELIHSHVRHHQMTNSNAVNLHRIISICTNGLILFNWVIIENTFSIQFRYIYGIGSCFHIHVLRVCAVRVCLSNCVLVSLAISVSFARANATNIALHYIRIVLHRFNSLRSCNHVDKAFN